MSVYSAYEFYSPMLDCQMVRLSMCDAHFKEFWMAIPGPDAQKKYRERRAAALDAISQAISLGLQPGEVRIVQTA